METFDQFPRANTTPPFTLQDFFLSHVGRGSYGTVYKAVNKNTLQVFAIKQILKKGNKSTIHHQLTTMYLLDSEYVVKLYDHFQDESSAYLLMEFVEGTQLFENVISKGAVMSYREIGLLVRQLCQALSYVHSAGVVHRDVKPENILITGQNQLKLTDFGAASKEEDNRKTTIGTPQYTAPQVVKGQRQTKAADVWAVGVTLFELSTLRLPFDAITTMEVYENIRDVKYQFPPNLHKQYDLMDLIRGILKGQPEERFGVQDILGHSWLKGVLDSQASEPRDLSQNQVRVGNRSRVDQLKDRMLQLEMQIHRNKVSQKQNQRKLGLGLQIKVATLEGKLRTLVSLRDIKSRRMESLTGKTLQSGEEPSSIQRIKHQHDETRHKIEAGNKQYMEALQHRKILKKQLDKYQQLTEQQTRTNQILAAQRKSPAKLRSARTATSEVSRTSLPVGESEYTLSHPGSFGRQLLSNGVESFLQYLCERRKRGSSEMGAKYPQ